MRRRISMRTYLALAALLASACAPLVRQANPSPVVIARFRESSVGYAQFSGFDAPATLVLRDTVAWRSAWALLHAGRSPVPSAPAIDFASEQVALVAAGTQRSGGVFVRIDSARTNGRTVTVFHTVSRPGPGCIVAAVVSQPVDLVRIRSVSRRVRFVVRTIEERCD